jgi:hypothetical protein
MTPKIPFDRMGCDVPGKGVEPRLSCGKPAPVAHGREALLGHHPRWA